MKSKRVRETISDRILFGVHNLPTLPTVYASIIDAMENPRTNVRDIADIISNDQASSFKVLKVANSPFYGYSGRIETVSKAILYLGFNEVQNIVLALSILNLFAKNKTLLNFRPVDFWAHSIGTALLARQIGSAAGITNLENYFLAGILHDIGKLFFFEFADKEYSEVLSTVEEKNCLLIEAEREVLGIDHTEVGRLLAEKWKIPVTLRNAISFHHDGFVEGRPDLLTAAVHIADILARALEFGYAGDDLIPQPNLKVWELLNLPETVFEKMYPALLQHYNSTVRLMLFE